MADIKLKLSSDEYSKCSGWLDKKLRKSGTIEVDRELLVKLILDHGIMHEELDTRNYYIKTER